MARFLSIYCLKDMHWSCDGSDCICHCHPQNARTTKKKADPAVCPQCGRVWLPTLNASESFPGSACDTGACMEADEHL